MNLEQIVNQSEQEQAEGTRTQLAGVLQNAVETISGKQEITFTLYVRKVLPVDGFVFWVNAGLLQPTSLPEGAEVTRTISGSLHRQVASYQEESESRDENFIIFTPLQQCDYFNIEDPNAIYLGEYAGQKFTFSRMESRYSQSGIWHYRGKAVLPALMSQLIESRDQLQERQIVSSSLPAWLTLSKYADVYPAYLTPNNLKGPYISVDCRQPVPLQAAPLVVNGQRFLLVRETVRCTLQQFDNERALNWIDYVVEEALYGDIFGISNTPVVEDRRQRQVEIKALDQSKTVVFEVNYYQATMTDTAKRLITEAFIDIEVI